MAFIGTIEYFTPGDDFEEYKERLEHLLTINKVTEDKTKVSYLITLIGPESYKILKSLTAPDKPDSKTYKELISIFEKYFAPKTNIIAERFNFYKRNQRPHESASDYIVELKTLSKTCAFGNFLDEALRDKLVCGLYNETVQQKLLNETGLTFDKACEIAKNMELTQSQMKVIRPDVTNSIRGEASRDLNGPRNYSRERSQSRGRNKSRGRSSKVQSSIPRDFSCYKCGMRGHIAKHCRRGSLAHYQQLGTNSKRTGVNLGNKDRLAKTNQVGYMDRNKNETTLEYLNNIYHFSEIPLRIVIDVNNVKLEMEVDSGACSTVIALDMFKEKFGNIPVQPLNKNLQVVTGEEVDVVGQAYVKVKDLKCSESIYYLEMVVIKTNRQFVPLLGRSWLDCLFPDWRKSFSIYKVSSSEIEIQKFTVAFPKVFSANFEEPIKEYSVKLQLKPGAVPIFSKPYTVPFGIKDKVEEELDKLVSQKILIPVKYSDWASPLVIVPKQNGDIRLCVNCKVTINKSIEDQVYPLPRIDDLISMFANCKVFCTLDLAGAYQQLAVDENSQTLLTINTHKGLFRYTRLPFGVSVAPAEFQRVMDEILKGTEGVGCYLDDLLIGGKTKEDCEEKLYEVLKRLDKHNVKVNIDKCKFFKDRVSYLGHIISERGIEPNPKKVQAIVEAPRPQNITQLKSFFGLLNFYNRFIPNLSSELRILYNLLKKNARFVWGAKEEEAFQKAKQLLLNNNILEHYDPNKEIVVTCDASPYGVGAVLAHVVNGIEKPVLFASSTLKEAEKNYSQTHREALAIIFAVKKFHKYLYGKRFIICTDHQPLKEIFNEKKGSLSVAAARLQRWAVYLSMYNYEIRYRRASLVSQADALSRLPLQEITDVPDYTINFCSTKQKVQLPDLEKVKEETQKDKVLNRAIEALVKGRNWVEDPKTMYFLKRQSVFSCENDLLYYGCRLVIPETLRYSVLTLLHESHIGVIRMKRLARSYVWWKGIDEDIEDFVRSCQACAQVQKSSRVTKDSHWKTPLYPFERVHIDFFHFHGLDFLLLVDSYSKWIELAEMKLTNAKKVIDKLRNWFSTWGIPSILVSDNGPPFSSYEFIEFCESNKIKVLKSPPYHPQSNGIAERAVQTVKQSFKKYLIETKGSLKDFNCKVDSFLLHYRNTPTTVTNKSPADILLRFKPATLIDMLQLKKGNIEKPQSIEQVSFQHKGSKNVRFKEKAKQIIFCDGENIFYRNNFRSYISWIPGKIIKRLSTYIYEIIVNGVRRTAHVDQLKKGTKSVRFSPFTKSLKNQNEKEEQEKSREEGNSINIRKGMSEEDFYRAEEDSVKFEIVTPEINNRFSNKKSKEQDYMETLRRSERIKRKYQVKF